MSFAPGVRLGAYEVLSLIGAGGMGEVYRARDNKLNRDVALKVLPEQFALDADRLARFTREAQVLASLNHPNIAAIYGLEEGSSGQHAVQALVLELVEGPTLAEVLAQGPRLKAQGHARRDSGPGPKSSALSPKPGPSGPALDEVLSIARQICEALEAAHENGLIHRDLKPANIKVRPDGTVKVLDFGLAKLAGPAEAGPYDGSDALSQSPTITTPAATRLGVIMGTAAYMSPEQAKGRPLDKRTDIWAFGCVLYEMLAGKRAFEGDDVSDTLASILKSDPDWRALPADTPSTIVRLLRRCLEKDPRRRLHDVADARLDLDERTAPQAAAPASASAGRKNREWLAWMSATVVLTLMVLALGAVVYVQRTPADTGVYRATLLPPANTSMSFAGFQAARLLALSPDGRRLAFVAAGPGGRTLVWVRPLDGLVSQPLAGTENGLTPFWSPDSRWIGFFADGKLKKIDAAGGPVLTLSDWPGGAGGGATWNQQDVIVFGTDGSGGLFQVSASGGAASVIMKPDSRRGETEYAWPFFLPDGQHFVYVVRGSEPGFYIGSLDSTQPKVLARGAGGNPKYALGHLIFLRDTTLMAQPLDVSRLELAGDAAPIAEQVLVTGGQGSGAFTVSETGVLAYQTGLGELRSQFVWFDRAGKQIGVLGDQADYGGVELSPDGTRAAVNILDPARRTRDIWLYDVARGLRTRFTFEPAEEGGAVWSPDGSRIGFFSARKGQTDLYVKASTGAGSEELLLDEAWPLIPTSWSRDGRSVLYFNGGGGSPTGTSDLRVLPLSGDRKASVFLQTPFAEAVGRFSPDGRWIAYQSNESGRNEVYVAPFPGPGGKWQISTAGGVSPRWRRDGREMYYLAPDNKLMTGLVSGEGSAFQVGVVRALFETRLRPGVLGAEPYDVSADGQRFLVNTLVQEATSTPITLVVNWTAGLKK